jgi:hypothetical protein
LKLALLYFLQDIEFRAYHPIPQLHKDGRVVTDQGNDSRKNHAYGAFFVADEEHSPGHHSGAYDKEYPKCDFHPVHISFELLKDHSCHLLSVHFAFAIKRSIFRFCIGQKKED